MLLLAPPPVAVGTDPDGPETDPPVTPFTSGAATCVVKGPLGPVLALRDTGLGALCPDMAIVFSYTRGRAEVRKRWNDIPVRAHCGPQVANERARLGLVPKDQW